MTKNFDMKNIEYARELARKHNEAYRIVVESKQLLDDLNLDYTLGGVGIDRHPLIRPVWGECRNRIYIEPSPGHRRIP